MARTVNPAPAARAPKTVELPAPRYATAWATLVYIVASMLLAYPALGGAFLINVRSDQYRAGYAFREFAASSLRSGHGFPQWNPYLLGGLPYIAAMHGDIFYPTFLLRMIMPTDRAMTWEFVIHIVLAGLFTYLFLRAWRLGFYSSLAGGLAYMMSGPIAAYASPGHDGKLFVSALLPLVLLLLTRGMRDGRWWSWGVLAFAVGMAVLSPHPQLLQYLLLTAGAFALYLAFAQGERETPLPRDVAFKRLGLALGAVILGALIGAIQFLPVREYVAWSPRVGGRGYDFATSFSMPVEELINTLIPQFSGILDHYWGRNGIHLHSEYAGAATILLATAAIGAARLRSFRRFWGITLLVSVFWALGGATPFYHIVYALVPGTRYFRAPSTMMYVSMFSAAVLAGIGVERVLIQRVSRWFVIGWGIAAVVIALLGLSGGFTNLAHAVAAGFDRNGTDDAILLNASALMWGAVRSAFVLGIVVALCWAIGTERMTIRAAAIGLAAVVTLDLWSIERDYWLFSAPAATLYASDPAIDALEKMPAPSRVEVIDPLNLWYRTGDPAFGSAGNGDALMVHGIRTLLGYHGNELDRFEHLMDRPAPDAGYPADRQLDSTIWRQENVNYLYTTVPDTLLPAISQQLPAFAHVTKVVGPVTDAAGTPVYLYKTATWNPLAWVAAAMVKAPDDQALSAVHDARFDPSRIAVVDSAAADVAAVQLQAAPAGATQKATATRYEPGAIDLSLDQPATAGEALIVSENYFPGWNAMVDGKAATVARMNYNLIGVVLPAGAKSIQLRFTDRAYETGKLLTLVALIVAVIGWGAGRAADRRSDRALAAATA